MPDLTNTEKRHAERRLQMGGGYVLDFSNRFLRSMDERSEPTRPGASAVPSGDDILL